MDAGRRAALRRVIEQGSTGCGLSDGMVLQLLDALDDAADRLGADREHMARMLARFRAGVASLTALEGSPGYVSRDAVLMLLDMLPPSWEDR